MPYKGKTANADLNAREDQHMDCLFLSGTGAGLVIRSPGLKAALMEEGLMDELGIPALIASS